MEAPAPETPQRTYRRAILVCVLVGVVLRVAYVNRPLDHRLLSSWHECDYVQLARNFDREGMNILYPRIDWRRDTPGYVECEFPLLPWTAALLYRVFGYHEEFLRLVSSVLGVASVFLFAGMARRVLPPEGALVAVAAFALNPQLMALSTAMQPESAVVFATVLAGDLLLRWEANPKFVTLLGACAAAALGMLFKLPAGYLGMFFAYVILRKLGTKAFTDIRVYAGGVVAVLPVLAWHAWAARFWHEYGNSMGVSNEAHFIGLDMLMPPRFLFGNFRVETMTVFTPAGWLLVIAALRQPRERFERWFAWYGAICVFYVLAARTSGDNWAWYYHCISVPAAALLMGSGAAAFSAGTVVPPSWSRIAPRQGHFGRLVSVATIGMLVCATGIKMWNTYHAPGHSSLITYRRTSAALVQHVPEGGRIVVSGGDLYDEYGQPEAYDRPMFFAWMDRKGFCYADEQLCVEKLEDIAKRGGRYWIVHRHELKDQTLKAEVDRRYRLVTDFERTYFLYDLRERPGP